MAHYLTDKVKPRLNQAKNFSLYSTYAYQHLVRVQQKTYHYTSKQIQDAIIILPEELEDVLINYNTYFDNKALPQLQSTTESVDWESMFTNAAGKLTKLANPALLEKLRECLLQPYPSISHAFNIIEDFYGTDRFPNMELSDWMKIIDTIDWDLPNKILQQQIDTEGGNNVPDPEPRIRRRRWSEEEMLLVLDLYFRLQNISSTLEKNKEIKILAEKINRTRSSVNMRLANYEYVNTGRGLSAGKSQCKPIWDKYVNNRVLLEQRLREISIIRSSIPTPRVVAQPTQRLRWSEEEMILALDLYFKLQFGQFQSNNTEVKKLAKIIGRTSSSVAMRLCNYEYVNTGKGLSGGEAQCRPIWDKYANNRTLLAEDVEKILKKKNCFDQTQTIPQNNTGKECLFVKSFDKSLLRAGLTLPTKVNKQILLLYPQLSKPGKVIVGVLFKGQKYYATLTHVNFDPKHNRKLTLQIRYNDNNPLAIKLSKECKYARDLLSGNKQSITEDLKQYIAVGYDNQKKVFTFKITKNI